MVTVTVDGRSVKVREQAYVLEACRLAGADVPTLCHHEAVEPYGACRLCMVEVTRPEWGGHTRMVASCLYPVEDGLIVHTATEKVLDVRRVVIDLLLARCPNTPLVRQMARKLGVEETSYEKAAEPTDCILCGLCTRVCDAIGPAAISAVNRGIGREIAPPFKEPPPACIGCLACAEICPTGHIKYQTSDTSRTIWGKTFEMLRCSRCGRAYVTREQAAFFERTRGIPASYMGLCDSCKRKVLADTAAQLCVTR